MYSVHFMHVHVQQSVHMFTASKMSLNSSVLFLRIKIYKRKLQSHSQDGQHKNTLKWSQEPL